MMWDADTAYSAFISLLLSHTPDLSLTFVIVTANNRFDKAVKNAIVASAEKLGAPAPNHGGLSSVHSTPTPTTAKHTTIVNTSSASVAHSTHKTNLPVPTRPAFKQPVFAPHPTDDAVAKADEARYEKAHPVNDVNDAPEVKPRINSRFFRF